MPVISSLGYFLSPTALRRVQFVVATTATMLAFGFAAVIVFTA
jgi:hypothetical protein